MNFDSAPSKTIFPAAFALAVCLLVLPVIEAAAQNEDPLAGPPEPSSIYARPYSLWESRIDEPALKRKSALMFGVNIGAMGILYVTPSVSGWEHDAVKSPLNAWWRNVSRTPVWDKDDWWLNYITHPYCGGIYYMGARSAGAGAGYSLAYSFALSTFFWEYGIEAFAERPSIQDLIVTPVAGAIVGEGFYLAKRSIVENDYRLLDSHFLGITAAWLMDPISEVAGLIWSDAEERNFSVQSGPAISVNGKVGGYLSLQIKF